MCIVGGDFFHGYAYKPQSKQLTVIRRKIKKQSMTNYCIIACFGVIIFRKKSSEYFEI